MGVETKKGRVSARVFGVVAFNHKRKKMGVFVCVCDFVEQIWSLVGCGICWIYPPPGK